MGIDQDGFLSQEISHTIDQYSLRHKDLFNLASTVNAFAQRTMLSFDVHSKNAQELLVGLVFIRCLSHYQAAIILCQRGMIPDARIVARALIEAMFILAAISKNYRLAVEYAQEDEFHRLAALHKYQKLHNGPPPGWTKEQVAELEAEVKKTIADKSLKKRRTEDWAKEADLSSWYLSVYFDLSESAHVKSRDVSANVVSNAKNEPKELYWGPSEEGLRVLLGTIIEAMCLSARHTANVFKVDVTDVDEFIANVRRIDLKDISGESK